MKKAIYLAGGLFNAGERVHNLYLEKYLKELGRKVVLPQREALKHFDAGSGKFDVLGIVSDCTKDASRSELVVVACLDGADSDSGTSIEYGMTIISTGRAVVYRTDFRTDMDREVGMNAMFRAGKTVVVYKPCFFTELSEVDDFYKELAKEIDRAVSSLKY